MTLSLVSALKARKLDDFIEQETARGIGPANSEEIDKAVKILATQPLSEDQTSRSSSVGCSTEK